MNERILQELRRLVAQNQPIQVLSFYQEFPITSPLILNHFAQGVLQASVQGPGAVCLCWQSQVWLLADPPLEAVKARVLSFHLPSGRVELDAFSQASSAISRRMVVRVAPPEPLAVDLLDVQKSSPALLTDISMDGAGLMVPVQPPMKIGQNLHLCMHFPQGEVEARARVNTLTKKGDHLRLSTVFTGPVTPKTALLQYIAERRRQITAEIEQLYQERLQQCADEEAGRA